MIVTEYFCTRSCLFEVWTWIAWLLIFLWSFIPVAVRVCKFLFECFHVNKVCLPGTCVCWFRWSIIRICCAILTNFFIDHLKLITFWLFLVLRIMLILFYHWWDIQVFIKSWTVWRLSPSPSNHAPVNSCKEFVLHDCFDFNPHIGIWN